MTLSLTTKFKIPQVPSFISTEGAGSIHISEFSEDDLKKIIKSWGEKLIQEAAKRRGF